MNKKNVLNFESRAVILEKASAYLSSVELFWDEPDKAVSLLLKALKYMENEMAQRTILLLGGYAKQEVAWPFYKMILDPDEREEIRLAAAIQLSVIFPSLKEPQPLIDRLLENIKSSDSELRMYAAFALGWEGNAQAVIPLIELLYDDDSDIQQIAVNSLFNFKDDRILKLMMDRLEHGPLEQKKCILFNLWRLYSKQEEVISIYLNHLNHEDDEIRLDALILLGIVSKTENHLPIYHICLKDSNPQIRKLSLERLAEIDRAALLEFEDEIADMVADPDLKVKQAAASVFKMLKGEAGNCSWLEMDQ